MLKIINTIKINKRYALLGVVFITGAVILILELTAVRILSPVLGSSLYVLSSILTVILSALSFGYWYGGKRSEEECVIGTISNAVTYGGLSILVLFTISKELLPFLAESFQVHIAALVASLLLFFLPVFLLGMISPLLIKAQVMLTHPHKTGSVAGNTLFWGTAGSIFGSLITGFYLIPNISISNIILIISLVSIVIGLSIKMFLIKKADQKFLFHIAFVLICIGFFVSLLKGGSEKEYVFRVEGIYSSIRIEDVVGDSRTLRTLFRDQNFSSAVFLDTKELVFPHTRFNLLYDKLNNKEPESVLVLGGGAYNVPRTLVENSKNLKVDVVEIEPSLFDLAQTYFDLSDVSNINNYNIDARVFLNQIEDDKYDLIFSDMFGTDTVTPFYLLTTEFFELVKTKLKSDGVLVINSVGIPKMEQPSLVGSINKTLKESFSNLNVYTLQEDQSEFQNVIFLIQNNAESAKPTRWDILSVIKVPYYELFLSDEALASELVLTDEYSPVEYLAARQ